MWKALRNLGSALLHPARLRGLLEKNLTLRLATALVSAVVVLLLILQVFTRVYYRGTLLDMAVAMQERTLAYAEQTMGTRMREAEQFIYEIAIDATLRGNMVRMDGSEAGGRARMYSLIKEQLRSAVEKREDLVAATMSTPDGTTVYYDRLSGSNTTDMWQDPLVGSIDAIRQRSLTEARIFYVVAPGRMHGLQTYHAALNIWDFYTHESIGTLVFTFDGQYLSRTLADPSEEAPKTAGVPSSGSSPADTGLAPDDGIPQALASGTTASDTAGDLSATGKARNGPSGSAASSGSDPAATETHQLIVLPDRTVLASADTREVGLPCVIPEGAVVREAPLNARGVRLVSILDQKALLHDIVAFQNTMLWFMLAVLAAWLVLLSVILGKVTRSLTHLRESIDEVRHGSLAVQATVETKDELAEIAEAFNSMVSRIRESDEAREIQTRERIHAIDLQRVAEIAALENQINSHFLYNTLNTIHYTAMEGALDKVSLQIRQLAGCLRYTFEKSSRIVTLSREIEWLQQYLYLQKQRYGKAFDYDIQVDPEVLDWPVRKLLIQPFLENAILHGFEGRRSGGLLLVRFRLFREDRLWVTIEDNGNGMSAARLERLRRLFRESGMPSEVGIGLENVHYRIRTYFGEEGRIYLSSEQGQGARFTLLLPKPAAETQPPDSNADRPATRRHA